MTFDGRTFPAEFVVPARVAKGAIIRKGVELDTPLVDTCMPGTVAAGVRPGPLAPSGKKHARRP